ncbi:MAG TPA: phosphate ABC transporter substrate-binding protein [Bacteroidetes bacterium]|nr:phosphate ABC transporter substrate-binding protein [Bacteroidota bacterium]
MKRTMNLLFLSSLSIFLFSCTRPEQVQVAGSTTVLPVVSRAAEQFKNATGTSVVVNAGGSGVGINQLGEGKIDIAMASRDITAHERGKFPGVVFTEWVIGHDAVIPVVSSEIYDAGVTGLSLSQLGAIYSGTITNWKEVGGPDRDILVVDKEAARGTRHVFMQAVLGDREAEAPGADLVLGSNNEEQTAIAQSDAAVGMLSHAWLNADVKGLAIITPQGERIEPVLANIASGRHPITRSLLLITNGEPEGEVKAFIDFILSEQGQNIVEASGYVGVAK